MYLYKLKSYNEVIKTKKQINKQKKRVKKKQFGQFSTRK